MSRGRRGRSPGRLCAWVVLVLAVAGARAASPGPDPGGGEGADLGAVLGGSAAGFARATAPRPFRFPDDHGPHPDFRAEWWYYTGNLRADGGRRFAFQLTFFRFALAPTPPRRPSAWATRQVYMAHFALTDVGAGRFHAAERFARGALGLAGAEAAPYRVWLGAWEARAGDESCPACGDPLPPEAVECPGCGLHFG